MSILLPCSMCACVPSQFFSFICGPCGSKENDVISYSQNSRYAHILIKLSWIRPDLLSFLFYFIHLLVLIISSFQNIYIYIYIYISLVDSRKLHDDDCLQMKPVMY
jgi:hypothetical protein